MRSDLLSVVFILLGGFFMQIALTVTIERIGNVVTSCERWNDDGKWRRGNGPIIQSWLRSVTATYAPAQWQVKAKVTVKGWQYQANKVFSTTGLPVWEKFGKESLDGWLYGPFHKGLQAFIYPDFKTVIVGQFDNKTLISGRAGRILASRCNQGILELKFGLRKQADVFKFEYANETFITSSPTLVDPHDQSTVYCATSGLSHAGQGIFAKRDIGPGQLITSYAGVLVKDENDLYTPDMSSDQREDAHKNLMSYDSEHSLDIPPRMSHLEVYRATLAHKINHKFLSEANSNFGYFTNPRFGLIRCVYATKFIKKDEEIFVDYDYGDDEEGLPRWYLDMRRARESKKK